MEPINYFYVFPQLYAIGELPTQIWRLRNLLSKIQHAFKLTIITYPLQKLRINTSLFNIALRGLNVVHTTDNNLIWFTEDSPYRSICEYQNNVYINLTISEISPLFFKEFQNQTPTYHFELSRFEKKIGEQLRLKYNIPNGAPIITLHVREAGYKETHGTREGSDGRLRNASIESYIPTIEYLTNEGYYVVRLGDNTMKSLPHFDKFIDTTQESHQLIEPYFISESKFYIGLASGPLTIADAFGTPRLCTNYPLWNHVYAWKKDLFIFKKYYSKILKRFLTYEEIICSEVVNFSNYDQALQNDIEVVENTPEEILLSAKEMIARLDNNYISLDNMRRLNKYFINIQKKAIKKFNDLVYRPIHYFFDETKVPISLEYIRLNSSNFNLFYNVSGTE